MKQVCFSILLLKSASKVCFQILLLYTSYFRFSTIPRLAVSLGTDSSLESWTEDLHALPPAGDPVLSLRTALSGVSSPTSELQETHPHDDLLLR